VSSEGGEYVRQGIAVKVGCSACKRPGFAVKTGKVRWNEKHPVAFSKLGESGSQPGGKIIVAEAGGGRSLRMEEHGRCLPPECRKIERRRPVTGFFEEITISPGETL
tara:strand:+ start:299 stop:619 length:321 start_codon:yes stop_codon:yes gene_type:complete